MRLLFRKFAELGTVNALLRYLVAHRIQLGMREQHGPGRGEVSWRRPSRATLQHLLKHPIYAGAYVYGRRPVDPRRQRAGRPATGRVVAAPADWQVVLRDRLPAYISWDAYEQNQAQLCANRTRADTLGVVREGPALLTRLVVCAHVPTADAIWPSATRRTPTAMRTSARAGAWTTGRSAANTWLARGWMRG